VLAAGDPETVGGTCTSSLDACFDAALSRLARVLGAEHVARS